MIQIFNTHFGQGDAGMVAIENLETGKRKRLKGINILALMASFLDLQMKGGVGLLNDDKEIIYDKIREAIIEVSTKALKDAQPHQQTCCTL